MIQLDHVAKRYGRDLVVDDVSFTCRPGTVTGFLGPNGAGKSTTLRMLTGLTLPSAGRVTIAGRPYGEHPNPGRVIGTMLDASAQHPGRTTRETLRLAARLLGVPVAAADAMLERVGLGGASRKRVGNCSLGMRQRLGIGVALLGAPSVLVLDEPANGMDPDGIRWLRRLLQDFAAGGGTALLSSHLLGEVQATVDHLVVIRAGRIVADDDLHALLASRGTIVRALDPVALANALDRAGVASTLHPDGTLHAAADAEAVGRIAAGAGAVVVELRDRAELEDLFFQLTA